MKMQKFFAVVIFTYPLCLCLEQRIVRPGSRAHSSARPCPIEALSDARTARVRQTEEPEFPANVAYLRLAIGATLGRGRTAVWPATAALDFLGAAEEKNFIAICGRRRIERKKEGEWESWRIFGAKKPPTYVGRMTVAC